MGHLKENSKGVFGGFNLFGSVPDTDAETLSLAARKADIFIVVNASTIELLDLERYVEETVGERPLVMWNLELDTLRADLGELYSSDDTMHHQHARDLFPNAYLCLSYCQIICEFSDHQVIFASFAGLLGFPPKELQYRFLSQFTPVFYIRQRDYSKVCLLCRGVRWLYLEHCLLTLC